MNEQYKQRRAAKHAAPKAERIKLSGETAELFEKVMPTQKRIFREKFGREMGPDDPIFFDEDADTPQPMSEESAAQIFVEAAEAAHIPPYLIYATKKTGIMASEENWDDLSAEQRRAWNDAVDEYYRLHPDGD
jgi:hypothetical protein